MSKLASPQEKTLFQAEQAPSLSGQDKYRERDTGGRLNLVDVNQSGTHYGHENFSQQSRHRLTRWEQIRIEAVSRPLKIQSDLSRGTNSSKVGVIIIGKNETNTISDVLSQVIEIEREFDGGLLKLFVDDCSTDDTLTKAMEFDFTILRHEASLGIGGAIKTGYYFFKKYRPEIVVQMDSDGEHPVSAIKSLVDGINDKDLDIVVGSRYFNGNLPETATLKIIGVKTLSTIMRIISFGGNMVSDTVSGFRAIKTSRIDDILFISEKNWAIEFALRALRNRVRMGEIPVPYTFRKYGESQFKSPKSYIKYVMNLIKQIIWATSTNEVMQTESPK